MLATFSIAYTRLRQWGAPGQPHTITPLPAEPPPSYETTDPVNITYTSGTTYTPAWVPPTYVTPEPFPGPGGEPPPDEGAPTIEMNKGIETTPNMGTHTWTETKTTPRQGAPGGWAGAGDSGNTNRGPLREWNPYPDAISTVVLHTKFWAKMNASIQVSHADDRIRKQGTATSSLAALVNSPPHESTGHPIGNSIESYQGFKTAEIWIRQISIGTPSGVDLNYACTDYLEGNLLPPGHVYYPQTTDSHGGNVVVQPWGSSEAEPYGTGTGLWQQLYYERPIEELKVIEWETTGSSEWQLDFFFRSAMNSAFFHRVPTFVHVSWHGRCGPQEDCDPLDPSTLGRA